MMAVSKYLFFFAVAFNIIFIPIDKNFYTFTEVKTYIFHSFILLSLLSLLINLIIKDDFNISRFMDIRISFLEVIKKPYNLFILILVLIVFCMICSTLLSPIPYSSFFGASYSRNGYSTYDILTLLTAMSLVPYIFKNLLSLKLLSFLFIIISIITSLYGLLETFGYQPLEFIEAKDRINSTFGNTLNFSSFTVMVIPLTLSTIFFKNFSRWIWTIPIGLILGLQISIVWITASRGSWIALILSLLFFILISIKINTVNNKIILKLISIITISLSTLIIIQLLPGNSSNDISTYRLSTTIPEVTSPQRNLYGTNITGGLTGRFQIWNGTMKLVKSWDTPVEEHGIKKALRPIFGVGPDLFVYSFHFVIEPQTKLINVEHAHNYYLHLLIELGFINLLLFSLLFLTIIIMSLSLIKKDLSNDKNYLIVLTGLLSAFLAKLVEMMVGVPRIEDLSILFIIMGMIISIYKINDKKNDKKNIKKNDKYTSKKFFNLVILSIFSVCIIGIIVHWDIRRSYASGLAALSEKTTDEYDKFHLMKQAATLAPLHEKIVLNHAQSVSLRAQQESENMNNEEAIIWAEMARDILLKYEKKEPFEWDIQLALAVIVNSLYDLGVTEYYDELQHRNLYISNQYPAYPTILTMASVALARSDNLYDAEILANRVIEIEENVSFDILSDKEKASFAGARYSKGYILAQLGYYNESVESLFEATKKSPSSEAAANSHLLLSQIYLDQFKDEEKANFHFNEYLSISEKLKPL